MNRDFIITVPWGGLGDHLFHSHLPRIAKEQGGYERVFVSRRSSFRRDDYRALVWELNPFVDGFTDEEGPVAITRTVVPDGMNLLDAIMLDRGLDDGRRYHEAEVYYVPNIVAAIAKKHVYDPNFVSNVGDLSPRRIRASFARNGMPDAQCRPGETSWPLDGVAETIEPGSVFTYCDLIASCETFSCVMSGGATLAPALGREATVYYGRATTLAMFRHSPRNTYLDVSPLPHQVLSRRVRSALQSLFPRSGP
jgi:hypothetical protein